ncbi:5-formyltetrahydrofolate cyclo-ligase [Clostridium sp. UBA6640]|uniref:5-formyltetrahydrofolate cyclo-ligase n=1 Tax=Clostridium sp. UBA6640 TaxID=1946370 RepID=UPI0025C62F53|nr:5-formyltetrahydrofolate cyclo-ligase [Clostridium sp. UBA6640]
MNRKSKKEIRKEILQKRDLICEEDKKLIDEEVFNRLISSDEYKKANTIFAFVSFKSEVDTYKFIEHALSQGKTVGVPKVIKEEKYMDVFKINFLSDLESGYFGVMEPSESCEKINKDNIDFILMPGAVFDEKGGRIGYGGGFYDKFLSDVKDSVPKIAIAYELQIIDSVPMEEYDIKIDGIITEKRTIKF